jgi:hypothetical protein
MQAPDSGAYDLLRGAAASYREDHLQILRSLTGTHGFPEHTE